MANQIGPDAFQIKDHLDLEQNRRTFTLTILAALFLPLTFVAVSWIVPPYDDAYADESGHIWYEPASGHAAGIEKSIDL